MNPRMVFEINKIAKLLTSQKRKMIQIINFRNEWGGITIDSADIKRILRECCEQPYADKFDNRDEIH